MKELYTVPEAARMLKMSEYQLREWLKDGRIKAFKLGKRWRIPAEFLTAVIEGQTQSGRWGSYDPNSGIRDTLWRLGSGK